jgi:probable addiction module antidote protein
MKKIIKKKISVEDLPNWEDFVVSQLNTPSAIKSHLMVALEEYEKDGNAAAFLIALRRVALACGGMSRLAKKAQINRQNLYKVFSGNRSPRLDTLSAILHGLGLRLSVESVAVGKK